MKKTDPGSDDMRKTPGSGNVFLDLGFPPSEAAVMIVRAELLIQLQQLIQKRRWTKSKAAKIFGIPASSMANLIKGNYEEFSVELLLTLAARAGLRPQLKLVA